jgi:hypothetical protein
MLRVLAIVLVLIALLGSDSSAATIYLRDRTRIEGATILEELQDGFRIAAKSETYALPYNDIIVKRLIFCIIDDAGAVRYPHSLNFMEGLVPGAADSLTAEQFQLALLQQQLKGQKDENSGLSWLGTASFISAVAAVSTTIALWSIYERTK